MNAHALNLKEWEDVNGLFALSRVEVGELLRIGIKREGDEDGAFIMTIVDSQDTVRQAQARTCRRHRKVSAEGSLVPLVKFAAVGCRSAVTVEAS